MKFNVEDSQDKEKSVKFDQGPVSKTPQQPSMPNPKQPNNQFTGQPVPLRTQSFNQNHPAFPLQAAPQNIAAHLQQNQPSNDYLTNLRNLGKGADNMMPQFSKNSPFSNLPQSGTNNNQAPNQQHMKIPSFPPPFNMPPPTQFNAWGREDLKLAPSNNQASWWGQNQPQTQGYPLSSQVYPNQGQNAYGQQRQDNKPPPNLQSYSNFNQSYPPQNQNFPSQRPQDTSNYGGMSFPQFGAQYQGQLLKPQSNLQNLGGSGHYDVFGSPWMNRVGNFGGDDLTQSSMSMRQAMLKEATLPGGRLAPTQQGVSKTSDIFIAFYLLSYLQIPQSQEIPPQSPGYSLFNNSSWAPSLPSQLRTTKAPENTVFNGPQHSLFGGPGPQSLAQLLEHQQNQMGHNVRNNSSNQDT